MHSRSCSVSKASIHGNKMVEETKMKKIKKNKNSSEMSVLPMQFAKKDAKHCAYYQDDQNCNLGHAELLQ